MNKPFWVVVLSALVSPTIVLGDQLVRFIEPNGSHEDGVSLSINGYYAGDIGDFIVIREGTYTVSYDSDHDYFMSVKIEVEADSVVVLDHWFYGPYCGGSYVLDEWGGARVVGATDGANNTHVVELSRPMFRAERMDACEDLVHGFMPLTTGKLAPQKSFVRLTINVEPTGVDVYRGDRREESHVGSDSDAEIGLPYDHGRESLPILLRKTGYVVCSYDIELPDSGNFEHAVRCQLTQPAKYPVGEETACCTPQ